MSDAPAAVCGDMCAGCNDQCAACAAMSCGNCGGCGTAALNDRRARAATAQLDLLQVFGFNPGQRRGPDGRFIKMGGRGSAGRGGLPGGSSRASEGGGAGAGGGSVTPAADAPGVVEGTRAAGLRDAQTARVRASKRTYTSGDRVPLADGTEGTVVGGHHAVPGRPGQYVAVRPDGGGKLKEVSVDALRKRQAKTEESSGAGLVEQGNAADARRRETAERRKKPTAEELGIGQRLAEPAPTVSTPDTGPAPVGFTPRADKDWNLTQKRLGKRTARASSDGELQRGDIVPTKDGKWAEVLGPDESKFWERNGLVGVKVRDDAKGYVHGESAADIKARIEKYNAEKAWREQGGSSDRLAGVATAPVNAQGLRPGEPPIGEDGKYAKPVKQYAVYNGQTYTRTSRNPYRYAAVVATRDDPEGAVWSWHRTRESAANGTLTGDQRRGGIHVKQVVETGFEPPASGGPEINANGPVEPRFSRAQHNSAVEMTARDLVNDAIDNDNWPTGLDRFKEREISDRLQELADAREAGDTAAVDRVVAKIRRLLSTVSGVNLPAELEGAR